MNNMGFAETFVINGLTKIAKDPKSLGRLLDILDSSMPNIETSTMGGAVFWESLADVNGWRLQQNKMFGNCRIIDPNNVRKAWGGKQAMMQALKKL
jgi:hypothetical protein